MIKCKDSCIKLQTNLCCHNCSESDSCEDACGFEQDKCGRAILEESTEVDLFQTKALFIMRSIAELDKQKKMLEAKDAEIRKELQKVMDECGIKQFENDIVKITYVAPTTRESIDSKKLKADLPEIAEKYMKMTQVKGSVRITVK